TSVGAGTEKDPHVVEFHHRLDPRHVAQTWVHEVSDTMDNVRGGTREHVVEPDLLDPDRALVVERNACVTSREREEGFLRRMYGDAVATGDREAQHWYGRQLGAVEAYLRVHRPERFDA